MHYLEFVTDNVLAAITGSTRFYYISLLHYNSTCPYKLKVKPIIAYVMNNYINYLLHKWVIVHRMKSKRQPVITQYEEKMQK